MPPDPLGALGEFLSATEAEGLGALLATGQHTSVALREVGAARREAAKTLMASAGIGHAEAERSVAVLRAIAGAKKERSDVSPVWTMPGNEAKVGHLTSEFHRLVQNARESVTCATYNFEPTSNMWTVLKDASENLGVVVTVYVDGSKADAAKVSARIPRANVYRSAVLPNGKQAVSHAKFIIIDHTVVLVTSANFSYSAENTNIEFGLLLHDASLAHSVETTMTDKHGSLYGLVVPSQ